MGGDGQSSFRVWQPSHAKSPVEPSRPDGYTVTMVQSDRPPTDPSRLAPILAALSHPKRLRIFDLLMQGVHCNCEIAEELGYSPNLISHHLGILEEAGLVLSERDPDDARWVYFTIDPVGLQRVQAQLAAFLDVDRIQPRAIDCGPGSCPPRTKATNL